jgi:hypothetical protein
MLSRKGGGRVRQPRRHCRGTPATVQGPGPRTGLRFPAFLEASDWIGDRHSEGRTIAAVARGPGCAGGCVGVPSVAATVRPMPPDSPMPTAIRCADHFLHTAINGHSRLTYCELPADEHKDTAAAFCARQCRVRRMHSHHRGPARRTNHPRAAYLTALSLNPWISDVVASRG